MSTDREVAELRESDADYGTFIIDVLVFVLTAESIILVSISIIIIADQKADVVVTVAMMYHTFLMMDGRY